MTKAAAQLRENDTLHAAEESQTRKWLSRLLPAIGLIGCLCAIYWQIDHTHSARFSFLFFSAVFAVVCMHWLLEELGFFQSDLPYLAYEH
jgi:hypothetical protein